MTATLLLQHHPEISIQQTNESEDINTKQPTRVLKEKGRF